MARIPDAELPADFAANMHNNLHRTVFNNLDMARPFSTLGRNIHVASRLPHRIRELIILRITSLLKADGEWGPHFKIAQMVGVSVNEARAIRDNDLSGFVTAERAALEFATAVEQNRADDQAWAAAVQHFTREQLLDMVMTAGFYGYVSRIQNSLAISIDAGLTNIADS